MQTAIYTIAKNETHNVAGFMEAAEDCPVYVLELEVAAALREVAQALKGR